MSVYTCSITPGCIGADGRVNQSDLYMMIVNAIGLHMKDSGFCSGGSRPLSMTGCAVEYGRRPLLYESVLFHMGDVQQEGGTFTIEVRVTDVNGCCVAFGVADYSAQYPEQASKSAAGSAGMPLCFLRCRRPAAPSLRRSPRPRVVSATGAPGVCSAAAGCLPVWAPM